MARVGFAIRGVSYRGLPAIERSMFGEWIISNADPNDSFSTRQCCERLCSGFAIRLCGQGGSYPNITKGRWPSQPNRCSIDSGGLMEGPSKTFVYCRCRSQYFASAGCLKPRQQPNLSFRKWRRTLRHASQSTQISECLPRQLEQLPVGGIGHMVRQLGMLADKSPSRPASGHPEQ